VTVAPVAGSAARSVTRPAIRSPRAVSTTPRSVPLVTSTSVASMKFETPMKFRDEGVRRSLVQVVRLPGLLDQAVAHDDDQVAHRQRLLLVVGHVDERDPDLLLEGLELELHLLAQLQVEGAERLVEQEHGGRLTRRRARATRCCWPPDSSHVRRSP
jgi:hypothetical protein